MVRNARDHGGGLDAAMQQWGGSRASWLDLSTGINPVAYPLPQISNQAWGQLPDQGLYNEIIAAARAFWNVPNGAAVLAVPGCSSAIAQIPGLFGAPGRVKIKTATYNEHAASFRNWGWVVTSDATPCDAAVTVYPNNPTGTFDAIESHDGYQIIDESFCDIAPEQSLIAAAVKPKTLILKSFGKFWGLAGLRLGFVIGDPALIDVLRERLGPWAISGPALETGLAALQDFDWANRTRERLTADAEYLDHIMSDHGTPMGNTPLFRTYVVNNAAALHDTLAQSHILTRIFPYSEDWIRFGLPHPSDFKRLRAAL